MTGSGWPRSRQRNRAWLRFLPIFAPAAAGPILFHSTSWYGPLFVTVLSLLCVAVLLRDGSVLRRPRREGTGIRTHYGRVTGRRRSALPPERCLARLSAVLDHDGRFRLDALTETTARATRLGNTVADSYPLEITAAAVPEGTEVVIDSNPTTSVLSQEEDTVRVVEDLLDVVGPGEADA